MTEQKTSAEQKTVNEDEIDLIELAKKIWDERKTILICICAGVIFGVFVAIFSSKEYTASTVMVPQLGVSQSKFGGLGGLAALAGINVDLSQSTELSPMIYPKIIGSIPFQLELMNTPINFNEFAQPVSLFDYYTKYDKPSILSIILKNTIGLPFKIIKAIKGKPKELILPSNLFNHPILLTNDQYSIKKVLDGLISLDVNTLEGYLTLTAKMPEALAAAEITQKALELLQRYVTEFKIEKAQANLDFIQGRYNEIKVEFEKSQVNLAIVNDRNKNFTSGLPRIEIDRVQTQYTISFNVFQELAKQLEQAKIQVKKETPVFTIIQPATIPIERSKPKRSLILVVCFFLGGISGVGIVFLKHFLIWNKQKWVKK